MARCDISRVTLRWLSPLLFFTLVGCGAMKWAYDYADWWVEYKLEQWVDLDGEQEDQLQDGLGPFFKWHRSTIMPRVTDSVSALIMAAKKGKCAERFSSQQALWYELYEDTIEHITPIISGVLTTLTPEQIDELGAGLEEDFKKAKERNADRAKKSEKFIDRMDSMLGDLTDKQRDMLSQPDRQWEKHRRESLACRRGQQQKLVQALKDKQPTDQVESILNGWWTQSGCPKDFIQDRSRIRARWRARMANLEDTLSSEQRESVIRELGNLRTNLADIIK